MSSVSSKAGSSRRYWVSVSLKIFCRITLKSVFRSFDFHPGKISFLISRRYFIKSEKFRRFMEDSKRFCTSSHSLCSGSISSYLSELARCLSNVSRAIVIRNKALLPRDSFRSHPLSDENSSEILTEALYDRRRKREKKRVEGEGGERGNIEPCFYFNPRNRGFLWTQGKVFIVFFECTILLVSILFRNLFISYYQSGRYVRTARTNNIF